MALPTEPSITSSVCPLAYVLSNIWFIIGLDRRIYAVGSPS